MLPCCDSMSYFYFLDAVIASRPSYINIIARSFVGTDIFKAMTWSKHLLWTPSSIPGWVTDAQKIESGSPRLLPQARLRYLSALKNMAQKKTCPCSAISAQWGTYVSWVTWCYLSTFEIWDVWSAVAAQRVADSPDKTWIHLYIVIVLSCHCLLAQSMYLWMSAVAALRTK